MPSAALSATSVMWDLVEESLDESEFLWRAWEAALDAHDFTLEEVALWREERLLGALDGVRLAAADALEPLLLPLLAGTDDPTALTVATYLTARLPTADAVPPLVEVLADAAGERLGSVASGLARGASSELLQTLCARLADVPPALGAVINAFSFNHQPAPLPVAKLLLSDVPELRLAAACALPYGTASPDAAALQQPDVRARNRVIVSGLRLSDARSMAVCRELLEHPTPDVASLLVPACCMADEQIERTLVAALEHPQLQRDALFALGQLGTRAALEACLAQLEGEHAAVAAESLCTITGLDLSKGGMTLVEADASVPTFEEEDLDADLVPSPDDLLPLPNPDAIRAFWSSHQHRFPRGGRFVGGAEWSKDRLLEALCNGPTRRRHAVAFELAALSHGQLDVQTRHFTSVQRDQFGQGLARWNGGVAAGRRPPE